MEAALISLVLILDTGSASLKLMFPCNQMDDYRLTHQSQMPLKQLCLFVECVTFVADKCVMFSPNIHVRVINDDIELVQDC